MYASIRHGIENTSTLILNYIAIHGIIHMCNYPIIFVGLTKTYDDICFHCGDHEVWLGAEVQRKKEEYSVVRPICESCFKAGKEIIARNPIKLKKRKQ